MGWTSTADPLENVGRASLFFYTKEEAMDFCTKHGWEYSVDPPNERKLTRTKRFASYGERDGDSLKSVAPLGLCPWVTAGVPRMFGFSSMVCGLCVALTTVCSANLQVTTSGVI